MLLGYGARNCCCFKDWMEVDLTLNDNVPKDVSMNLPAATAMCFRGANASGKTNGLKVLSFIVYFASDSFMSRPDQEIPFDTHFYEKSEAEFYVSTHTEKADYLYEFRVTDKEILEETISRKFSVEGSRETVVFHRVKNEILKNTLYKGHDDIPLRSNASIISTLHQYNIEEIEDLYSTFSKTVMNVTYQGMNNILFNNVEGVSEQLYREPEKLEKVSRLIQKFDTGIEKISIGTKEDEQGKRRYFPVFYHKRENLESFPMTYSFESSGTQKLFCQLFFYISILEDGGLMILDEFEINLHPDILPYLIDMFIIDENNRKHAQLLFTTQNSDVMDIMGKYRTYLFEKKDGESICYRVDELGSKNLRNDRPISVPYRKKLLGGVPIIEEEK